MRFLSGEDNLKGYDFPPDLVLGNEAKRKSILFNNGNFDINNPNKYMSLLPWLATSTGGTWMLNRVKSNNNQ